MTKKFKVGDIVQLKSGGPIMTVDDIDLYPSIHTKWFDSTDNSYCEDRFSADSLIKIKRNSFTLKIIQSFLPSKKSHDKNSGTDNKKDSKITFLPGPKNSRIPQIKSNKDTKLTKEILNQDAHQLQYIKSKDS